jgi:hypothetical protein
MMRIRGDLRREERERDEKKERARREPTRPLNIYGRMLSAGPGRIKRESVREKEGERQSRGSKERDVVRGEREGGRNEQGYDEDSLYYHEILFKEFSPAMNSTQERRERIEEEITFARAMAWVDGTIAEVRAEAEAREARAESSGAKAGEARAGTCVVQWRGKPAQGLVLQRQGKPEQTKG